MTDVIEEEEGAPPPEFLQWLASLALSKYADSACHWWVENGAATLEEVLENWEDFAEGLGLKPLERKRLEKDVACRLPSSDSASSAAEKFAQELGDWLEGLCLSPHLEATAKWCTDNGASSMSEVWGNWEELASNLDLKTLERKRMEKDAQARQASPPVVTGGYYAEVGHIPEVSLPPVVAPSTSFGPPEDPRKYLLREEIGFGVTSKVYRCQHGNDVFAAKAISLKKLKHLPHYKTLAERFDREIAILLTLKHKRIVKLFDVVKEENNLYLVMELVKGGELAELIVRKGAFSELMARNVFVQIAEGLCYIHSKGIIHRDLKPDNILVDEANEMPEIKLTDFGHSRLLDDGLESVLTARIGTAAYWAPEVSNPAKAANGYDQTADLWSLGVVVYVMLIGFFPFERHDHFFEDQLQRDVEGLRFQRRGSSNIELTPEAQSLVRALLTINPQDRLSLTDCLKHKWVVMFGKKEQEEEEGRFMKLSTDPSPDAVEVRVPLTVKPTSEELHRLRGALQQWMHKFKFFATIRQGDVIANLGDASQADQPELKMARSELQSIVERHCGRGVFVVNDRRVWSAIAESRTAGGGTVPGTANPSGLAGSNGTASSTSGGKGHGIRTRAPQQHQQLQQQQPQQQQQQQQCLQSFLHAGYGGSSSSTAIPNSLGNSSQLYSGRSSLGQQGSIAASLAQRVAALQQGPAGTIASSLPAGPSLAGDARNPPPGNGQTSSDSVTAALGMGVPSANSSGSLAAAARQSSGKGLDYLMVRASAPPREDRRRFRAAKTASPILQDSSSSSRTGSSSSVMPGSFAIKRPTTTGTGPAPFAPSSSVPSGNILSSPSSQVPSPSSSSASSPSPSTLSTPTPSRLQPRTRSHTHSSNLLASLPEETSVEGSPTASGTSAATAQPPVNPPPPMPLGVSANRQPQEYDPESEASVVAALQGLWVNTGGKGETYRVRGLEAERTKGTGKGLIESRPFTLRWNVAKRRLEWGLAGKYYLQAPESVPMLKAVWITHDGKGRPFSWKRVPEELAGRVGPQAQSVEVSRHYGNISHGSDWRPHSSHTGGSW